MRDSDSRGAIVWLAGAFLVAIAIVLFILFTVLAPPVAKAADDPIGSVIIAGKINYADASFGPRYLAVRAPRGTLVNLCGPGGCVAMRSTDYGPEAGHGKIADVALVVWAKVCGEPVERAPIVGVCAGNAEYPYEGAQATLPPTDIEEDVSAAALTAAETLPTWRPAAIVVLALAVMGLVAYATAGFGRDRS